MHIDRFLPGGIYDKIPLKMFAIVDFCEAGKVSRYTGEPENYYRIDVDWENCKFTLITAQFVQLLTLTFLLAKPLSCFGIE
jgi:hypothetical protein